MPRCNSTPLRQSTRLRFTPPLGRDATLALMPTPICLPPLDLALRLMREADVELFAGHHAAAERLAHRAAELRGWV